MSVNDKYAIVAVESGRYTLAWEGNSYTIYANDVIIGGTHNLYDLYDYMDGDYINEIIDHRENGVVVTKLFYYVSRNGKVKLENGEYTHPEKGFEWLWSENCVLDLLQAFLLEICLYLAEKDHGEEGKQES